MLQQHCILSILVCLCAVQVFVAANCTSNEDSNIKIHCDKLIIGNGSACYSKMTNDMWKATIKCRTRFYLLGSSHLICYYTKDTDWIWSGTTFDSKCVLENESSTQRSPTTSTTETTPLMPTAKTATHSTTADKIRIDDLDEKDGSRLVVDITVPVVIMFLIAIVLFLTIRVIILRRRTLSANENPSCPICTTLAWTNRPYVVPVDNRRRHSTRPGIVEGNGSEYDYIDVSDIKPINTVDSEYNIVHLNTPTSNISNCNYTRIHTDTYTHTASRSCNGETSCRSGETGNVYNALQVDNKCIKINGKDVTSVDPRYEDTNTCAEVLCRIDHNTYAHANNDLYVDDNVYEMCQ